VGNRLTLQEWAEFQALYAGKRALVDDWAESEDRKLVFNQMPQEYRPKVLAESAKRRRGKFWVRVSYPNGCDGNQIQGELEHDLGKPLRHVTADKRQFVIACDSVEDQIALLDFDNASLNGHVIRVQRAEYHMSGDDILEFIRGLLELEDEERRLGNTYGAGPTREWEESRGRSRYWQEERNRPKGAIYLAHEESVWKPTSEAPKSPTYSDGPRGTRRETPPFHRSTSSQREEKGQYKGKGDRGKGSYTPPSKGKMGSGKGPQDTKGRKPFVCRACQEAGKPSEHNFYQCEFSKEKYVEREEKRIREEKEKEKETRSKGYQKSQQPTSPKAASQSFSQKGKGGGKGKGKSHK
jgi:hypothetical protein